jgi:hypothetical protein
MIALMLLGALLMWGTELYFDRALLKEENGKLTTQVEQLQGEEEIRAIVAGEVEAATADLHTEVEAQHTKLQQLQTTLAKHDLSRLAVAKPGLVENRINTATQKAFKDLEDAL